jgi:transposase-like protein
MERPDLDTLACVNTECQVFRQRGQGNLSIRKVYGHDHLRPLCCHTCGEEFSERRGTALFNTKLPEAKATDVVHPLDEGCSVRATARLVKVSKETVARLLRQAGRHAERFHERHVHGLTSKALECDEQWSFVKNSSSGAKTTRRRWLAICGITQRSRRIVTLQRHLYEHAFLHKGFQARKGPLSLVACDRKSAILRGQICSKHYSDVVGVSWWSPWSWASGPRSRRVPCCTTSGTGCGRDICWRSSPMPMRATRQQF